VEIVGDMLECDEPLAKALVECLSEHHDVSPYDGDSPIYDSSSYIYEIHVRPSPESRLRWSEFRHSIQHRSRYFNRTAADVLHEILGKAIEGDGISVGSPIQKFGGPKAPMSVYRARVARDDADWKRICADPTKELGPPPADKRSSGRMNAAGVRIFYGALDVETCVAEVRTPVGGVAIVGKFDLVRPLRLFDMRQLAKDRHLRTYFRSDLLEHAGYLSFLRGFHREISSPIAPGTEEIDYLPTQFVAEYLANLVDPRVDGIIYRSALTSPETYNVAIFAHAAIIEGADRPPLSDPEKVDVLRFSEPDEDDPSEATRVELAKPMPARRRRTKPRRSPLGVLDVDLDYLLDSEIEPFDDYPAEPVLKLALDGVVTVRVKAIDYKTEIGEVVYVRPPKRPPKF
jgi:hypothetical protein